MNHTERHMCTHVIPFETWKFLHDQGFTSRDISDIITARKEINILISDPVWGDRVVKS